LLNRVHQRVSPNIILPRVFLLVVNFQSIPVYEDASQYSVVACWISGALENFRKVQFPEVEVR
jgi:hypothetical protein